MTSSAAVPPERDTLHSNLQSEVEIVKAAMRKVLKVSYTWPCCNCGHQRGYTNTEEGIGADEVREAVAQRLPKRYSSSIVSIALFSLLEEGFFTLSSRMRILLAEQ